MDTFTCASLCSGYGGIELGLRRVVRDIRTVLYMEIEAFAQANLVSKIKAGLLDDAPVGSDIKALDSAPWVGKVDILTGGFPCQPFSSNGRRQATEDPRHLYPTFSRLVGEIRPNIVFLENVEGIISTKCRNQPGAEDGEPVLFYVLRDLEKRGYETAWGVFGASEVGAPQQRRRVFILGRLEGFEPRVLADAYRVGLEKQGAEESPDRARQRVQERPVFDGGNQHGVVADSDGGGRTQGVERVQEGQPDTARGDIIPAALANPEGVGIQGHGANRKQEPQAFHQEEVFDGPYCQLADLWPVPNGNKTIQFWWEPPRAFVGKSKMKDDNGKPAVSIRLNPDFDEILMGIPIGWSDPEASREEIVAWMRFANESAKSGTGVPDPERAPWLSRSEEGGNARKWIADRLHMIGNGVVPAAAALAFRTLLSEFLPSNQNVSLRGQEGLFDS